MTLGLCFAEPGAFVFGTGLAIVPFLYGGVVERFAWLDDRQFLDAVAVAMITPGPVVITVAFIGYLVAGVAGATVAALGVFLPCYLLTVIPAPHFRRWARNRQIRAFVDGAGWLRRWLRPSRPWFRCPASGGSRGPAQSMKRYCQVP